MASDPLRLNTHVLPVKRANVSIVRARRAAGDLASAANIVRLYTSDDALARLLDATAADVRLSADRAEVELREGTTRLLKAERD